MKTRHVVIVVLGAAALVWAFVGGRAAQSHTFPEAQVQATLFRTGRPGFIVVQAAPGETVTVPNPRADENLVFYITAILERGCANSTAVYYPPELQHPDPTAYAWQTSTTNWTAGMLLPLVTTIDVVTTVGGENPGCIVFAGYYSRRTPHITSFGGE